ncbi:HNH endonuclease [Pseudobacteriovorax antillogorgiicola]|uniref:5-methylcytosine-specific restriction endonuclease McrA n=1 Tax=Pseudobacteriovorax antillogorgiicola TaxID=1513793 RepID=A0A1Y6BYX0_9BACT|nr:HNH endonuclease [Pseudobacteriovorax antillogorgiicola]TCS51244.1 5-methylcytosine-specific restriction endonuclease McrA [Pseudobacteriovorax antillogorgiicola]SMF36570.1 5-methylcytosine-specific restriction endonuclease McrA [Pseudobacteriovorax antillogorgiicola]
MRTLVLNASYEPIDVVTWQRAITLVMKEKAEMISSHVTKVRSVSRSFSAPKVIRLKRYISVIKSLHQGAPYSRINVFKRDRFQCQYCAKQLNAKSATIDHVVPQSKGGGDTWENTVCCCEQCNRKKGNHTLDQAKMVLIAKPKRPSAFTYILNQLEEFGLNELFGAAHS